MTEASPPDAAGGRTDAVHVHDADSGVRIIRIIDALDIHTSPGVQERVSAEMDDGTTRVCLDLDGVSFIDSTGLAAIIDLQRHANRHGAFLALACGDGAVRRLIELAFLERQLPVYADVTRALDALTG